MPVSARTDYILFVLREIRDRWSSGIRSPISRMRKDATTLLANNRQVEYTTAQDKYQRQLEPQIKGVGQFDRSIEGWLLNGSSQLMEVILDHATNGDDVQYIKDFFGTESPAKPSSQPIEELDGSDTPTHVSSMKEWSVAEGGARETTLELIRRNSRRLRKKALAEYGGTCQVCGFNFGEYYGELGTGYIEVHHLRPLSNRKTRSETKIEDVTVVCANCHRVLHLSGKEPLPLEVLRNAIHKQHGR